MLFKPTNIEEKLRYRRDKIYTKETILEQVCSIFDAETEKENLIMDRLSSGEGTATNPFNYELLESTKIYRN